MSFNSSSIAEKIRANMEKLIETVSEERRSEKTADQMERQIWWSMLSLGRELMQLFFTARSEQERRRREKGKEESKATYIGQKKRGYLSLFGRVEVERASYWQKGKESQKPLDEELSLPERLFSDWVQEIVGELSVVVAYKEAVGLLGKWFHLEVPKRSALQCAGEHGVEVAAYYEQKEAPEVKEKDSILTVSADGKGIPMNRENSPPPKDRRGKGTKKTAKKDATISAIYTISPFVRTANDIIAALLPEERSEASAASARPKPTGKQVFGTLAGKKAAFEHLARQAAKRETKQLADRIALTDGSRALQLKVEEYLPDFSLILDIIHALEYLWEAANVLFGETNPERALWIEDTLRCLLEDEHDTLFKHLEYQASAPGLSQNKAKTLTKVLNYLRNNQAYMDYQHYLAQGWPIGTGVIEGACRHLVKDRFELAGMRWSLSGAQTMLDLRAVHLNSDWDDFQRFRRQRAHLQLYASLPPEALPEITALDTLAA